MVYFRETSTISMVYVVLGSSLLNTSVYKVFIILRRCIYLQTSVFVSLFTKSVGT